MGYVRIRFNLLSLSLLGSHFLAILCVQVISCMINSRSFYLNFIPLTNIETLICKRTYLELEVYRKP